ncbi:hypothetical protein CQA09_28410, partial [Klebsiella pneumoniae]
AMSQEQLWAFVDQIGQSTLFPPRQDLLALLKAPRAASGIAQDRVSTCCKFGLDAAQADFLGAMSQEQLWAFVDQIGQSTLFPPRQDLLALLKAP